EAWPARHPPGSTAARSRPGRWDRRPPTPVADEPIGRIARGELEVLRLPDHDLGRGHERVGDVGQGPAAVRVAPDGRMDRTEGTLPLADERRRRRGSLGAHGPRL